MDDSATNRRVLSRLLQVLGHSVVEASDGVEALERIAAEPFDVVLLDMIMPRLDGYEVLERLKADGTLHHLPVIVISGQDDVKSVVRCIEIGAEDYLGKPFAPLILRARLDACLEKKRLRDRERSLYDAVVASQKQLAGELGQAAAYVRSLLPAPVSTGTLRVSWEFVPSSRLGGDGFGYGWLDSDHFSVYLLDACGHGVGSALLSISAMHVLRSQSLPGVNFRSPAEVAAALNESFPMEAHNNLYFTLWYGVYHQPSRTLRYVSGGHPPAILVEAPGTVSRLRTKGAAVGCLPGARYTDASCAIPAGTELFVFSDGAYEVERADGTTMELDDLIGQLTAPGQDRATKLERVLHHAREQGNSYYLDDDVSLLQVTFD